MVKDAPPLGIESGNAVAVESPAGNDPRVTLGVPDAPNAVTVRVIVLFGTMASGLGVTESEKDAGVGLG